jgi:hypothetical protein
VLEHCREGETNCWFYIFRAFPSDRITKATKDVNVHFFIHSFTSREEIIMDSALIVKKKELPEFGELFGATTYKRKE